jgi:hypothetical protein
VLGMEEEDMEEEDMEEDMEGRKRKMNSGT